MEIADDLRCMFSTSVNEQSGSYIIEIPKHEVTTGNIQCGAVYRTVLLSTTSNTDSPADDCAADDRPADIGEERTASGPPVQEGDVREVDIDDLGDQGDGIARVEQGYVVIVPETTKGERVTIEITNVRENAAFSEVIERNDHFQ